MSAITDRRGSLSARSATDARVRRSSKVEFMREFAACPGKRIVEWKLSYCLGGLLMLVVHPPLTVSAAGYRYFAPLKRPSLHDVRSIGNR